MVVLEPRVLVEEASLLRVLRRVVELLNALFESVQGYRQYLHDLSLGHGERRSVLLVGNHPVVAECLALLQHQVILLFHQVVGEIRDEVFLLLLLGEGVVLSVLLLDILQLQEFQLLPSLLANVLLNLFKDALVRYDAYSTLQDDEHEVHVLGVQDLLAVSEGQQLDLVSVPFQVRLHHQERLHFKQPIDGTRHPRINVLRHKLLDQLLALLRGVV